jgi:hypothetical protein
MSSRWSQADNWVVYPLLVIVEIALAFDSVTAAWRQIVLVIKRFVF